jgi:hypothetical protein
LRGPLRNPAVTGGIVGIHGAQQVSSIAGAGDNKLSPQDVRHIEQGLDTASSMSRVDAVLVGMIKNPKTGTRRVCYRLRDQEGWKR